ncbi:hypothetical protein [Ottowia beijingensis]|uniref:DUF4870 family protein n=1 Tax=Ottowia beijingensis TaxID=1207057 RepID=UPI002FD95FAA
MRNNDIIDVEPINGRGTAGGGRAADSFKTWGWVSYVLHLIVAVAAVVPGAQVSIALLIIALVMDLVKKDDAAGTWQESHFKWRIRSVLWAGVLYLVTFPFFLLGLFLFNPAWIVISIWFLYRIVKGMVRMNAGRAVIA